VGQEVRTTAQAISNQVGLMNTSLPFDIITSQSSGAK